MTTKSESPAERVSREVNALAETTLQLAKALRDLSQRHARRGAFLDVNQIKPAGGRSVISGKAASDVAVLNATHQTRERLGQLLRLEGKKQSPLPVALPGEIAAVAKLKDTITGDTLCDEKAALLAGFGRRNLRIVPHDENYAMRADGLRDLIERDLAAGALPTAIVATTGTTTTTALDPIEALRYE